MKIKEEDKNMLWIMAEENDYKFNLLKSCEELTELQEKLLKKVLKELAKDVPTDEQIIEEIGDVFIRLKVLERLFDKDLIQNRIDYKMSKFKSYYNEGLYKTTI